jgi:hypothetical protein
MRSEVRKQTPRHRISSSELFEKRTEVTCRKTLLPSGPKSQGVAPLVGISRHGPPLIVHEFSTYGKESIPAVPAYFLWVGKAAPKTCFAVDLMMPPLVRECRQSNR